MAYTDNFRRQHDEILLLVSGIIGRLQPQGVVSEARQLRTQLSALSGKLSVHLAMEDKALYPRLAEADVPNARTMAAAFMTEMGGLGQAFAAYNQKWQVSAIADDATGFIRETRAVFAALGKRIERENAELYPLADHALGRAAAPTA